MNSGPVPWSCGSHDPRHLTRSGFDACTAGDERFTAENFFKKLDGLANAKASDIFKSGAFDPPGAKK